MIYWFNSIRLPQAPQIISAILKKYPPENFVFSFYAAVFLSVFPNCSGVRYPSADCLLILLYHISMNSKILERTLAQGAIVTTLIDLFRLPPDFPENTQKSDRIDLIEEAIHIDFGKDINLIPYNQKHEFEALLFSNISGFEIVIDKNEQLAEVKSIIETYSYPEDINNSPELS